MARHDGRVVFVRHTLPGERVVAQVTGVGGGGRYWFADAVAVLEAAEGRVAPPCPFSGAGGCGGCDYQHVEVPLQRRWKSDIVAEQLRRLGGTEAAVPVESVPGDAGGLSWRTRIRYGVDPHGRLGLRAHRSSTVVPLDRCRIADERIQAATMSGQPLTERRWEGTDEVVVVAGADEVVISPRPGPEPGDVLERAAGRRWRVAADGFWQVHPGAADALVGLVLQHCRGDSVWDLYSGVGLLAGAMAAAREGRTVAAVEGDRRAAGLARRNLADLPGVAVHHRDVRRWVADPPGPQPDTVVLDPPRRGAGGRVLSHITATSAGRIVYIACDPASLGRDTGLLSGAGWRLVSVVGLDMFPMTHHTETVAAFER